MSTNSQKFKVHEGGSVDIKEVASLMWESRGDIGECEFCTFAPVKYVRAGNDLYFLCREHHKEVLELRRSLSAERRAIVQNIFDEGVWKEKEVDG
jgi:hypothetical protein